jgi:hypothetical protein
MAKILITGNGFDLHHKLPTKYQDFLEIMLKIEAIKEKENYCYDAYGDSINMLNEICKQNEEILKFASAHDATWKNFTSSWIEETFGERIEVKDTWADILVTVIK